MIDTLEASLHQRPGRPLRLDDPPARRAAVAAILAPSADLMFIRRSERPGDPWSGHMAFPGGHVDPTDPTVRAAAEREAREEVGLDLGRDGRLIGQLDELVTPARAGPAAMTITPFVYRLRGPVRVEPNHEVAAVHWFSLAHLAGGEGRGHFELDGDGRTWRMPCLDLDGVRIWGLTLRMLDDLLERLGP